MASKKKKSETVTFIEKTEAKKNISSEINLSLNLEDSKRLLRELQLREIELELKNEELKKNISELQKKLDNYTNIENHAPLSERIYRAIGESIDFGIWVCNPDGRNTYASDSFLNLVGQTQEQCSNFGWGDALHPDDADNTIRAWKECVKSGSKWDIEHRFKGVDGNWHHILARGVPVRDDNGEIICWAGINLDIDKQKQTEQELQQSKQREQERATELETILEDFRHAESTAHIGSFQLNLKTGSCSWSDELFRICGLIPQSLEPDKRMLLSVVHPEDRQKAENIIRNSIRNKTDYKFECRVLRPNGEVRYIISMGDIIIDANNTAREIKGVFQDITDLKKVELSLIESQENYRILFESMPVGLAISDISGKVIYGNRKSRILLGISRTELKQGMIDLSRWKFMHKDGREIQLNELPNLKVIKERRSIENTEIGIIKENNRITWLNVTAAPMPNHEEVLIAFMDISEKIDREQQLKDLSEKLRELNATKDKFFSIIAHDLKNPFNSILGFSELLLKYIEKYNSEEIERFASIISSTSQNAYNLLENLLNWSRSQTGNIEFNPKLLNLAEIVSFNLEFTNHLALKKNISFISDFDDHMMVEVDKNMIDTVLRNIFTNAVKFSYPGGKIKVEIRSKDRNYEVSVKDDGMGIEKENIDKLFRIDNKYSTYGTSQEKGSGLGLIICKEFIERNRGQIWVVSELGKGSEFIFTLPKAGIKAEQ